MDLVRSMGERQGKSTHHQTPLPLSMKLARFFILLATAAAINASMTFAAVIVPVSATASSVKSGSSANHLIDGSGLFTDATGTTPDNSVSATHVDNSNAITSSLSWVWSDDGSSPNISEEWVEFDLGSNFNVSDAYVWQTTFSTTGRQTRTFDIEYSTNGIDYSLAASNQFLGQVTTLTDGSTAETFHFSTVTARYIRIGINGTYERTAGDRNWLGGLGEVRFEGTAIPEPSAALLGSLGALLLLRRRRS